MDMFRSVVFALLNLVLLVNGSTTRRRRFGLNVSAGYGKRGNFLPGFGKRPYVGETGETSGHGKAENIISSNEQGLKIWDGKSGSLTDWNKSGYYYPDYESLSQRNVEDVRDYPETVYGYTRGNPNFIPYGNDNRVSTVLEDRNGDGTLDSNVSPKIYRKVGKAFAEQIAGVDDRQNPVEDETVEIAQLLKKLLSGKDQGNNYPSWQ